jgi:hypothetical protein
MGYRIRQIEAETKFTELMGIETLTRIIPMETIHTVLKEYGAQGQRERRLPGWLTVLFCIGMNLLSELSMTGVMEHLMRGTRLIHDAEEEEAPSAGAYSQARARLGAKVMERLFKAVCRPLATPMTQGAFTYGLRLVAFLSSHCASSALRFPTSNWLTRPSMTASGAACFGILSAISCPSGATAPSPGSSNAKCPISN